MLIGVIIVKCLSGSAFKNDFSLVTDESSDKLSFAIMLLFSSVTHTNFSDPLPADPIYERKSNLKPEFSRK